MNSSRSCLKNTIFHLLSKSFFFIFAFVLPTILKFIFYELQAFKSHHDLRIILFFTSPPYSPFYHYHQQRQHQHRGHHHHQQQHRHQSFQLFLQSVSIRIFQLYRNSVIRSCIASERIITIITWVITSTTCINEMCVCVWVLYTKHFESYSQSQGLIQSLFCCFVASTTNNPQILGNNKNISSAILKRNSSVTECCFFLIRSNQVKTYNNKK